MQISNDIYRREFLGAVFIVTLGSAMHFAFDWSGGWKPIAIFAAVNESIWEHLKLAFWPGLLWAAFVRLPSSIGRIEVLAARGISLAVVAFLIVAVFRTYTAILGRNILVLDIGTFVFAICIGQWVSAWLLARARSILKLVLWPGNFLLVLQLLAYGMLTFFPPDHWLFIEASTGQRGID